MGRIRKSIQIAARPDDVFAYMDSLEHRGHHMLGMGRDFHAEILSENSTGLGATYRWRGSMYGVSFSWTEVVTKWVKDQEKFHRSVENKGWVAAIDMGWTVTPRDGGTLLTLIMDYDLGYSFVGKLLDRIWAERYCGKGVEGDFRRLKEELEKPSKDNPTDPLQVKGHV